MREGPGSSSFLISDSWLALGNPPLFRAQACGDVGAGPRRGGVVAIGGERFLKNGPGVGIVLAGCYRRAQGVVCRGDWIGLNVFGLGFDLRPSVASFMHTRALISVVGADAGSWPGGSLLMVTL